MKNNKVLDETKKLSEKYNKKEKVILEMFDIGIGNGYSIEETKDMIDEFEKSNNCY